MGDNLGCQRKIRWHSQLAQSKGGFEVADAFFHAAIVAWKTGWIVQRQHAETGHDIIHVLIVKRRAVVAFEEQGRAVLTEQAFEMGGDLAAIEPVADQWPEPIT